MPGKTPCKNLASVLFRIIGVFVCALIVSTGVIGFLRSSESWELNFALTNEFTTDSNNSNWHWAIRGIGIIIVIFGLLGILAEMRLHIFKRFLGVLNGFISIGVFHIINAFLCVGVAGVIGLSAFIICLVYGITSIILKFTPIPFYIEDHPNSPAPAKAAEAQEDPA